jgi:RNA polymerase sigma-70 factor, ECF subfamily
MQDYDSAGRADAAFATFYDREYPRAAALARSLCGSWAVAEELTQDAFLVAWRRWEHVRGLTDPGQWVRRVVANRAVSGYRRARAERRALRRLGPGASLIDPPGPADPVLAAIAGLPAKQAQAIAAVYVDQLDTTEAAALLGCSESTLRTHLQRGRAALRGLRVVWEADR